MQIIKEQLGRVSHFLIILIPLFIVNAIFNLKYDWGGVSAIARVYIMVLSFYIIFVFSQIDVDEYRAAYSERYGWKGKYYLFFVLRIFPFLFIYVFTIIFTLINYINTPDWPLEPLYKLLDGRYSNNIFYALILFLILRQKKRPGVSIPLFILFSVLYYAADTQVFSSAPGLMLSLRKMLKNFIFIFILVYDYSKSRWKFFESIILSLFAGMFLFASVTSFFTLTFFVSAPESTSHSYSRNFLLKSGFVFPMEEFRKTIIENGTPNDIEKFFQYIEKYGEDTGFTTQEWEKLILKNIIENNEAVFSHLNRKKIQIDFKKLKEYAVSQFLMVPVQSADLKQFAIYFGSYYTANKNDFYDLYKSGNEQMKIIILKSLAYTDDTDALFFLIDNITSIEKLYSEAAYNSLKKLSGKDPAADLNKEKYDIEVVLFFRDYAAKRNSPPATAAPLSLKEKEGLR